MLAKAEIAGADVLLLPIPTPDPSVLKMISRLTDERPQLRLLVLGTAREDHYALLALKVGASGYITSEESPGVLARAIRYVRKKGKYVTPSMGERLAFHVVAHSGEKGGLQLHDSLTEREYEILCMYGTGRTTGEIAKELSLSPKTVSSHRARILRKIGLRNTPELVRYAVQNRLIVQRTDFPPFR
ncbi:MAG: DNA-binding response regulator [Gemmatimonadota bacterium]